VHDLSSIPLPCDIAPPSSQTATNIASPPVLCEGDKKADDSKAAAAKEVVNQKRAHESAYGGWEQVVYEE
jgi:hypothetical protein